MASWESNSDITRDMDYLSEIKSSSPTRESKSYTVWGRGRIINHEEIERIDNSFDTSHSSKSKEEFTWFPEKPCLEKLPDSIGRGKRLEMLKESFLSLGKDLEVHQQVRAVMGPGHSNAYIEASYRQRVNGRNLANDFENLPIKQTEDSEERQKYSCTSALSSPQENIEGAALDVSETPGHSKSAVNASKEKKGSQKRKPRRYRNAVLESLAKLEGTGNVSELQTNNSDIPLPKEMALSPGKKNTNIPPAGYTSKQYYSSTSHTHKVSPNLFVLKESDFPKL